VQHFLEWQMINSQGSRNAIPVKSGSHPSAANGGRDDARAKQIYFSLLSSPETVKNLDASREYLAAMLDATDGIECDFPESPQLIPAWIIESAEETGRQYQEYLAARHGGAPRRLLSTKSHALYFLQSVAPTKLVDGSWLFGLVKKWHDIRFFHLIEIYLEELGEGIATKNHVLLYKQLLQSHGCIGWESLSDEHFTQGTIQLSFAYHPEKFLPELIGFNLGYEQLPLHLPISAYELTELGINPYYFKLHLTVDNASTGHARKSLIGLLDTLPRVGSAEEFYRRVKRGYKLNMLGACTNSVIESFDLNHEMISILTSKGLVGKSIHSDYCRVENRTVNEWLADPAGPRAFLEALQRTGWIERNQPPEESRFWKLIHGPAAKMFGVFSTYEEQVIHDWIAGDISKDKQAPADVRNKCYGSPNGPAAETRVNLVRKIAEAPWKKWDGVERRANPCRSSSRDQIAHELDDYSSDLRALERQLSDATDKDMAIARLIPLMSPSNHYTPAGLMATRIFTRVLRHGWREARSGSHPDALPDRAGVPSITAGPVSANPG
jgi:hypothetical protein